MLTKGILLSSLTLALTLSACTGQSSSTSTPLTDSGVIANPLEPDLEPILEPAAVKPLPAGGTDVLGPDTFQAFERDSNESVKIETFAVTGRSFTQARRITGLKPLEQPYLEQLGAETTSAIAKGDVLVVQFWAKSARAAPAQTEFVLEQTSDPYDKSLSVGVPLTSRWTLYSVPFTAQQDYAVGGAAARFRLGYANQSFELGGVVLKNYRSSVALNTLPVAGFTYAGRGANAAWRTGANARIEQLRKADLRVKLVDGSGKAVSGALVKLEMQRHAFPFGSAVDAQQLFEKSSDGQIYQKTILELFNRVVLENDLKWPNWEEYTRSGALEALKFFQSQNIAVRGHNLLWPCDANYCLPDDVVPLLQNPAGLRSRIDGHLQDILGATKGQIVEWDVINEPSANKRFANVLGEDEMAKQLERAKQLEPNAKMFLNDYGNLGEGDLELEFKRILRRMQELKAPLEGIGLQAHFGYKLTPPEELYTRLEDFGQFGVPLAITEFDINMTDEKLQADYLRDFLTVAFSSKHVNSFLMWGFWEGRHWLPDAALYRKDWSLKPSGKAFKDLLFKTWWTVVSGSSDVGGQYSARGFLGDYKLTVTANGKTTTRSLKLEKGMGEVVITL
jgi:endo-1,4-beta-xylanase